MNRSVLVVIIVAVLLIGAGGAYVLLGSDDDGEKKTYDVRVGYLQGDLHQLARVVANDDDINGGTNMYKDNGLNISTPNPSGYLNGGAVMDAFAAGEIDIGFLGAPPAILKSLNVGTDIIIVSKVNSEGSSIVVKDNIDSFTDLKGKTVATPGVSSIQHLMFLEVAEANGMNVKQSGTDGDSNTVYFVQVAPKDMKAALQTDQVQGAVGWEPYGSDILQSGAGKLLMWSGEVWADHPCCVIAVKRSFAETNPETVKMFLKAHIEANELIDETVADGSGETYDRLIELATSFSGTNESVVLSSLDHMDLDYTIDSSFNEYLESFTQSYIDLDLIDEQKLADRDYANVTEYVDDLVKTEYLNAVD